MTRFKPWRDILAHVLGLACALAVVMLTNNFYTPGSSLPVEWAILWFLALLRLHYEIRLPINRRLPAAHRVRQGHPRIKLT